MCQLIWSLDLQKAQHAGTAPPVFCRCCNQLHDRWDLVRYEVEREHGMVVCAGAPAKASNSCIVGIRLCDINKPPHTVFALGEDARMQLIGPVVLMRFPIPAFNGKHRPNTFIPNKITETLALLQHKKETETQRQAYDALMASDADEETKLNAFVNNEIAPLMLAASNQKKYPHPSAAIMRSKYAGFINYNGDFVTWADANPIRPPPPAHWRCMRCYNYFEPVHYAEDCPSLKEPDWIPMNRRSKPYGIPRFLLFAVNMDNVQAVATAPYVDDNGRCWIRK